MALPRSGRSCVARTDEVVLDLLRAVFLRGESSRVRGDRGGPCEQDLLASLHRSVQLDVGPLFARQLLTCRTLPPAVAGAARETYDANLARNLYLKAETDRWVAALRAAGIGCRPLKGVDWSRLLFEDLGARTCDDIDLLVRPEDLSRAEAFAACRGFIPIRCTQSPSDPSSKARVLARPAAVTYSLDLHWRVEDPQLLPLDHAPFWPAKPGPAGDAGCSPPPDLVGTLLCLHLWRHALTLKTLVDFAAFVHRFDDVIPAVRKRLEKAHALDGLLLALALADRVLAVRSAHLPGRLPKRRLLPLLERCLHLPANARGRYFKWLVNPLEFDGAWRPMARLTAHLFRWDDADGRLHLSARLARVGRVAVRAALTGPRLIRREADRAARR